MKLPISVTIITKNEEDRIAKAIESVKGFASEIIVVDSASSDHTVDIAHLHGARVVTQKFLGYGGQKNFAQDLARHDWVLSLDADECVSEELAQEIVQKFESGEHLRVHGFSIPRKTWYLSRWIYHGGWYPNSRVRLAHRHHARWDEPVIHETWRVDGEVGELRHAIEHYSFPYQRSHILKNVEYAEYQMRKALRSNKRFKFFKLIGKPTWKFIDMFWLKAGFMDGMPGLIIAIHSAYATFLSYSYLYESTAKNSRTG